MSATAEKLVLPSRDITFAPRKHNFVPGEVNTYPFTEDGKERTGYLTFEGARLIGINGRIQPNNDGRNMLVLNMGIVLDNPETGQVDEDGNLEPHAMHVEERYEAWQNDPERPKRIQGQQWVQPENYGLVMELVNYLHDKHNYSIIQNPRNRRRPGAPPRKRRDLFVVRPASSGQGLLTEEQRRTHGTALNAFEVSVNPEYPDGFKSFVQGVEEQRRRWEDAFAMEDAKQREQLLEQIAQNANYLGGVQYNKEQQQWWPRAVDVGMVSITDPKSHEPREWTLYKRRGERLTEDTFQELFATVSNPEEQPETGGVSVEKLSIPGARVRDEDEDDF